MGISVTYHDRPQDNKVEHMGRVVKIRTYVASRNHSDTLDYSDFRDTEVTEALVYLGRHGEPVGQPYVYGAPKERDLEAHERFAWVDCTNLFVWRGSGHRVPKVDTEWFLLIPGFLEDYEAWEAYHAERARIVTEKRLADEKRDAEIKVERERNRPVKGKRMEVFKGRKVPVGTQGTVAFISDSGSVLLKGDDVWQDRKADGVWVNGGNLKARA